MSEILIDMHRTTHNIKCPAEAKQVRLALLIQRSNREIKCHIHMFNTTEVSGFLFLNKLP